MRELLVKVSGRTSLHMPATGGRAPLRPLRAYRWDTTELPVTDDLYRPTGAIAEAERLIAISARAEATLLLHGGSTAGIHAMFLYAARRGDAVILPRNAHLSAVNICVTAGIEPVFAEPSFTPEGRVYTTPEAYAQALDACPRAAAVFALHGDYYGLCGDIAGIARVAHARGRLLMCDEAHGATRNWRRDLPNAGALGADLFVQSAHKTLPALTSAAWLHAMAGIDVDRLRATLRMVQTSSPSFLTMLSLDDARAWMDAHGEKRCERLLSEMECFRRKAAALGYADGQSAPPDGFRYDRLRLVLRAPEGGGTLQHVLAQRKVDVEMSDADHIVCIVPLIGGERALRRLLAALRLTARARETEPLKPISGQPQARRPLVWPPRALSPDVAAFAPGEPLLPADAVGRVSAVCVGLYPPGVAWLIAGDAVTPEIAELIAQTPQESLFGLDANGRLRCVKPA